uniref:Uncharacterized protein n=1 Tax=Babesia bovis TaxID=5865 RepID=A7ARW0_BABBO|eukprot:XP_001610847.1 hypothetical protein [Babesia bovis T2Bo]
MDIPPIVRCVLNRIDGSNLGRFSRTIPKEAFTTKECTTTEDNTKPKGCSGNSNGAPRDLKGHKKPSLNVNSEPWTLAEAPGASTPKIEKGEVLTKPNKEARRKSLTFKPLTLSKLIEADIAETATLIKSLVITPGASCEIHDCFDRNIETLAQTSLHRPINLSKKVLKVVIARVNSILDLFSFTDSTKLIFALAHLDTRLIPIYQPLITHYIYCLNNLVDGTSKLAPQIENGIRYVSKSVGSNTSDISDDASDVSLNSINNKCVALHCNKVVPLTQLPNNIVESIAVVITSVEILARNILQIRPTKPQDVGIRTNALDVFKNDDISDKGNVSIRDRMDPTSLDGGSRNKSTNGPANGTQENSIAKTDSPYMISMDHCFFGSIEDLTRQWTTNETLGSTFNSSVIEAPDISDSDLSSMFKWLQTCAIQLSSTLERYLQMIGTRDNTYLLPIAQLMGTITLQLPTMCEYVFSNVNLDVMDGTELHDFIHACALSMNIHQVDLSNVIKVNIYCCIISSRNA